MKLSELLVVIALLLLLLSFVAGAVQAGRRAGGKARVLHRNRQVVLWFYLQEIDDWRSP